jgi:hypothetical protein
MKILNIDFNESVKWNEEIVLDMLKKHNKDKTEKELKVLIRASKLIKNELPKVIVESGKGKAKATKYDRDSDNI